METATDGAERVASTSQPLKANYVVGCHAPVRG